MDDFNDERVSYQNIKDYALDAYYYFCRDSGVVLKMSNYEVTGYVSYEYEDVYKRPIEKLMLCVVLLILNGGWYPEQDLYYRSEFNKIIQENHSLNKLLENIPQEESELFQHDIKIIGLI